MRTWLEPFNNRVLVEPDVAPEKIGELYVPENVNRPPEAGTVLRAAEAISSLFPAGSRVFFMAFSGRRLLEDGKPLLLMGAHEILGFALPGEPVPQARHDQILIERDEQLLTRGRGVVLPDSARAPKSPRATVVSVGSRVDAVEVGDRVLVAGGVGRLMQIGERTFYSCSPNELLGRIVRDEADVSDAGESMEGRYTDEHLDGITAARDEGRPDEGLPT